MYALLTSFDYRVVNVMVIVFAAFLIAIRFCLLVIAVKLAWKWIVPDLLPGMVAQGKVTGDMSYKTALKVIVVLLIFAFLQNPSSFLDYKNNSKHITNTASTSGPQYNVQARGIVISTAKSRNQALISNLRDHHPNISESEVGICLVGEDSPEEVLKCLDWAVANGVKVMVIDGTANRSRDARVIEKIKVLNKAGFYIGSVQFA